MIWNDDIQMMNIFNILSPSCITTLLSVNYWNTTLKDACVYLRAPFTSRTLNVKSRLKKIPISVCYVNISEIVILFTYNTDL